VTVTRAADMTYGDHRARALELIDTAEDQLQGGFHEWAAASAALATAHLEAARRYQADGPELSQRVSRTGVTVVSRRRDTASDLGTSPRVTPPGPPREPRSEQS